MSEEPLVCFAVPQEAKPFQKLMRSHQMAVRILVTGMGSRNAQRTVRSAILESKPSVVFTCGFAGALSSNLKVGDLVCTPERLVDGAKAVRFVSAERVAVTAAEKAALAATTGAEAVEMESSAILNLCKELGIPCTTLRVISDESEEDLPLDFNALVGRDENLSPLKLAIAIIKSPHKIPALLRLGRNSARAADKLAQALVHALSQK